MKSSVQPKADSAKYIVGIDLGTTNCAVAYIEKSHLSREPLDLKIFEIPQLTRPGSVEKRPLLPSFVYIASSSELPEGSTALPWDKKNKLIVGELARSLGAKVPGRLVASAKSWLCSPSVDRTAAILPWGAPEDVKRISPVEASARYLEHIREAWDHEFAGKDESSRLANQEIVITVPASFDEAARELTVEAAILAGFPHITLIEEPQAAFYAWMAAHSKNLAAALGGIERVLICDVGGGTTDFSLIEVQRTGDAKNPVDVRRTAVGDHLMLGGDNMDLALARHLEKKISGHIDAHQFKALTASARDGKERILLAGAPEKMSIAVMGRGSSVIGGSVKTELLQSEARAILLEGFFPVTRVDESPQTTGRSGIREWGLPYVHDPAVTRHLSQFLRHHILSDEAGQPLVKDGKLAIPRPDAVLFNGGAMKPDAFRQRLRDVLKNWFGTDVLELQGTSLDLAVALGAAYYGCVRQGRGLRIGGGMGRGYYIGIETDSTPDRPAGKAAICLVPQGTEEGEQIELPQSFILRLATPVVFPLFSSSVRPHDKLGTILDEESKELAPLPPLETMLHGGRRAVKKDVAVRLQAALTEVGTLALALKSMSDDRKWEIHLNVRSRVRDKEQPEDAKDASAGVDPRKVNAAVALIGRTFDPQARDPLPPAMLTKQMEAALELSKDAWPAALARRLADVLLERAAQRNRSAEHEARWLNLTGFLLRPGFGDLSDAERMKKLYNATRNGLFFVSDPNTRIEWWVLWRRVSGGLKEDHERELFYRLQPFLTNDRDVTKRGGWPRPTKGELPEMWRAAASLELLDNTQKKQLGELIVEQLQDEGPTTAMLWALARLGARQPAHAEANYTVPTDLAESWLKALLGLDWAGNPMGVFAAVSLARKTGDRARDISDALRNRTLERLKKAGAGEHDIAAVKTITDLESADRKLIFGDALPPALKLEKN